jgi:glycosyltransferase involved in cell wall biosynthesis
VGWVNGRDVDIRITQMKNFARVIVLWGVVPLFAVAGLVVGVLARWVKKTTKTPRLVWGSTPLINNSHWSRAMSSVGYSSETFTLNYYASINNRTDWDRLLGEQWRWCPSIIKPLLAFLWSLNQYDVFFLSADGYFIGRYPGIWRLQALLLKLACKKVVFIPYGGDAYVYRRIHSSALQQGLIASYPIQAKMQSAISSRVDYWCRHADVCIPAIMGMDGFGRWDVLVASPLFLDLNEWRKSKRQIKGDGRSSEVIICHAPNHRGFKGSEFIIDAVKKLQDEGLKVRLLLLEKIHNTEVRRCLAEEADILVEQLIATGHGLNGLEGLASGVPVISNLEDDTYMLPMRRWSYFSECPIVSATPENLVSVLRKLVTRPKLRKELGCAGRQYAEKYHGMDSAVHLFEAVIDLAYGRRDSLINLYHPLLGEYTRRKPRVEHPLVNNRIVD